MLTHCLKSLFLCSEAVTPCVLLGFLFLLVLCVPPRCISGCILHMLCKISDEWKPAYINTYPFIRILIHFHNFIHTKVIDMYSWFYSFHPNVPICQWMYFTHAMQNLRPAYMYINTYPFIHTCIHIHSFMHSKVIDM